MMHLIRSLALLAAGLLPACVMAAEPANRNIAGEAFFEKRIRPVLVEHCYKCHSPDAKTLQGELRLDSRAALRRGGSSGPAIVPGDIDQSLLIDALRYDGLEMPPAGKLPQRVIADFQRWIRDGAPDPRNDQENSLPVVDPADAAPLWSLEPLAANDPPTVKDATWPRDPIDRFVLARLEEEELRPVVDAARPALARRLYFDLIGLPPSVEEQQAFAAEESPAAVEKLVDRLLSSPHFGERWGRYWLDVARFAESNGSDRNVVHPHAWRYRNYVIDAFNRDKPYNDFLREQLAGDLLPAANQQQRDEQLVATGLLTLGPKIFMEPKAQQFQMDVVDEQIEVIGRAMLGLTISCARCHDHKFDPISTRDYYALAGILGSTELLYGPAAPAGNQYGHDRPLQPIGQDAQKLQGPAEAWQQAVADQTAERNKARSDRYRVVRQKQALENELKKAEAAKEEAAKEKLDELTANIARLAGEIKQWDEKINALDKQLQQLVENPPPMPDYAMAVRDLDKPADCRICIRGEVNRRGDMVPRGLPQSLADIALPPIAESASGRLQLAEFIASKQNPLTARVAVNRIWQHLFGEGLVRTVDNFGKSGQRPSHPALLDYLAGEFIRQRWSVKQMVRRLVLSRVYRLGSLPDESNLAADPENRLLWRHSRRRLDAEALRDALLSTSGMLDPNPPTASVVATIEEREFNQRVQLSEEQRASTHRSVYLPIVRLALPEMLQTFDFADPSLVVGRRTERTTPAQQLFLLNSSLVHEYSQAAAERLLGETQLSDAERIDRAYQLILCRLPSNGQRNRLLGFLNLTLDNDTSTKLKQVSNSRPDSLAAASRLYSILCQALYASAEFRYID